MTTSLADVPKKKNMYVVIYQYQHGNPRISKVKATSGTEAAKIVEHRRFGNYVLDVELFDKNKRYEL